MKSTRKSRLILAALAASTLAVSACAPSIPPGSEVADELIDTLDLTDGEKACMHDAVAKFAVPVAAGTKWQTIDDVAKAAADDGDAQAQAIIDDFFVKAFKTCEGAAVESTAPGQK